MNLQNHFHEYPGWGWESWFCASFVEWRIASPSIFTVTTSFLLHCRVMSCFSRPVPAPPFLLALLPCLLLVGWLQGEGFCTFPSWLGPPASGSGTWTCSCSAPGSSVPRIKQASSRTCEWRLNELHVDNINVKSARNENASWSRPSDSTSSQIIVGVSVNELSH